MTDTTNENSQTPQVGRNEPCPCGSGKKFKRCHGVDAAPKVTPPKAGGPALPGMGAAAGGAPGADPFGGQMDQAQMMQVMQALQRLPRGQVQKLQAIMQKAMGGKDVTREAQEFERTLPLEFQEMMRGFQMPGAGAAASGGEIEVQSSSSAEAAPQMSEEEARRLVAEAAAAGQISQEKASELLEGEAKKSGAFGRLFRKGK